uniref:Uncharacterized protein n=1 Tax=Panagrolaimus davidi TaxID=227884 RepID=A0A914QK20_9BILA
MHFQFKGTLVSSEPTSPFSISDSIFSSYCKNQLPFPSLQKHVSQERRIIIQDEVDKEIQKEIQAIKAENEAPSSPAKNFSSVRRQQIAEINQKAIYQIFGREHAKYAKYESEYWEVLKSPFPSSFNMIEEYKKREKILELQLGECQCRLDEIFRRKIVAETTKTPTISFSASRKLPKMFKARR